MSSGQYSEKEKTTPAAPVHIYTEKLSAVTFIWSTTCAKWLVGPDIAASLESMCMQDMSASACPSTAPNYRTDTAILISTTFIA